MLSITDELKFYEKLQNFFNDNMGQYQVGDVVYYNNIGIGIIINANHPSMLKIKFGSCPDEWFPRKREYIRIPLVIDSLNPSRGLVGMLKKFFRLSYVKDIERYWQCTITRKLKGTYKHEFYRGISPELAVLKALMVQENIR